MAKIFNHDKTTGKDEWLTPPEFFKYLGPFDLDPCSPVTRPWDTASKHYTKEDDGLSKTWQGFVWCNPPYGTETEKWIAKLSEHEDGIALIFARTETKTWHKHIWPKAKSLFFMRGRISFYDVLGNRSGPAGAPSVLVAFGKQADERLQQLTSIPGVYVKLYG